MKHSFTKNRLLSNIFLLIWLIQTFIITVISFRVLNVDIATNGSWKIALFCFVRPSESP